MPVVMTLKRAAGGLIVAALAIVGLAPASQAVLTGDCDVSPIVHQLSLATVGNYASGTESVYTCTGGGLTGTMKFELYAPGDTPGVSTPVESREGGMLAVSWTPYSATVSTPGAWTLRSTFTPYDGTESYSWDDTVNFAQSATSLSSRSAWVAWSAGSTYVQVSSPVRSTKSVPLYAAGPSGTVSIQNAGGAVLATIPVTGVKGGQTTSAYGEVQAKEGDVLTLSYSGDAFWMPSSETVTVTDSRAVPTLAVNSIGGETLRAWVEANVAAPVSSDLLTGTVDVTAQGKTYTFKDADFYIPATFSMPLPAGTYPVTVNYEGNQYLKPVSVTKTATIGRAGIVFKKPVSLKSASTKPGIANTATVVIQTAQYDLAPGATVRFDQQLGGSKTWTTLKTVTTSSAGVASVAFTPRSSQTIRAVLVSNGEYVATWSPTATTYYAKAAPTTAKFTAIRTASITATTNVKNRKCADIKVTASPGGATVLQVRSGTTWRYVATKSITQTNGAGSVTFTVAKGTSSHVYRAVVKADAHGSQAISGAVTVARG